MTLSAPVRVLVVDDETLFRAGLVELLRGDGRLQVVGQAADGAEALRRVEMLRPDVVLMDIRMPRLDGIEATARIVAEHPDTRVLVLTAVRGDDQVVEAMRAGSLGFVLKDSEPESLVTAILAVNAGDQVVSHDVGRQLLRETGSRAIPRDRGTNGLTDRQVQILRLMAAGYASKQIARQLGISDKTVRNQSSLMYAKLHVQDRGQAILYAVRKGLVA